MTPAISSLLMVVGLWLGMAMFCCSSSTLERPEIKRNEPPLAVSAERLISEYKANEISADRDYKDRRLRVTGRVDHIGKDIIDSMYVTVGTGEEFELVSVQCFFDNDWGQRLSYLREGETITIEGRCDGKFGNVLLRDCIFPSK